MLGIGYLTHSMNGILGASDFSEPFSSTPDYNEKMQLINEEKNKLPASTKTILSSLNVTFKYNTSITESGLYVREYSGGHIVRSILIKDISYPVIYAEAVHAVQDYYGLMPSTITSDQDPNHTMCEFQERLVGYFRNYILWKENGQGKAKPNPTFLGLASDSFLQEMPLLCPNKAINVNYLDSMDLKVYFTNFRSQAANLPSYNGSWQSGFDFKWRDILVGSGIAVC